MTTKISPLARERFEQTRRKRPSPSRLYNLAGGGSDTEIYLYGYVGVGGDMGFTAAEVSEALAALENTADQVAVYVNSPGGSYDDGRAIYNMLARFAQTHRLKAVVDGVAASAASFLLYGAPRVEMNPGTSMMIHEVHGGKYGRAQDLEAQAKLIRQETEQLAGIYARKTGKSSAAILKLLAAETWFTAEQAIEERFADALVGARVTATNTARTDDARRRATNLRIANLCRSAGAPSDPGPARAQSTE
jgi:ATP-dependent Clp endopeptidase proteolytic subunit ClpP